MIVVYSIILVIVAVVSYGIGSMDTLVLASNYVFRANLRKLGKGNSWISNFRRVYGLKGILLLLLTEVVKDALPILFGGLALIFKGHFSEGCVFAGFCLVMGRLWPIFYNLKGSHATLAMIVAAMFAKFSFGAAIGVAVLVILVLTKRLGLATFLGAGFMMLASLLMMDGTIMVVCPILTAAAVFVRHIPEMIKMAKGFGEKIELKEDLSYKFDEKF